MLRCIALCSLLCVTQQSEGQVEPGADPYRIIGPHLGVGIGQDVGGIIGARMSYWPTPYTACFVGGGWALAAPAWNAGLELRVPTGGRVSPFALAMHGYNAGVYVKGKEHLNALFYGPTIGVGVMLRQRITRNYWRFSINLPFRSQEFEDHRAEVGARSDVEMLYEPLPITLGIGFHLCLAPQQRANPSVR